MISYCLVVFIVGFIRFLCALVAVLVLCVCYLV